MTKKILSFLISLSISVASFTAFAYDASKGSAQFMAEHAVDYENSQEIDEDKTALLLELVSDYGYTEDEALEVLEDFKKSVDENSKQQEENSQIQDNENQEKPKEDKSVDESIVNKKNVLEQLEIITDEEFDYFSGVRRDKFAGYTADMINYGDDYSLEEGYFKFSDVAVENEKYHAIANLINRGAIIGVGGGLYKPEEYITINQACAILVRVTGYDLYKMPEDENDVFYWNKANEMNLLKGINLKNTEVLTGENAVKMLYNLLYAEVVSLHLQGNELHYKNDTVFLREYMNLDYADGIVKANSKTSLHSESGAVGEKRLQVSDYVYYFEKLNDLDEFLGKNVRVFYELDGDGDAKAIIERENYNSYITVSADMIENFDVTDSKLTYTKENEQKIYEEKIPLSSKVIFNGVAVDYEYNKKHMLQPMSGEITILDNNRDSIADVVFVTSYVYYLGAQVNSDIPILYDNFGIQPEINLDSINVEIIKDGELVTYSSVGKDSLLMVKPSRAVFDIDTGYMYVDNVNASYITVEISGNSVNGNVSAIKNSDYKVKIENDEYNISPWLMKSYVLTSDEKFMLPSVGYDVSAILDKYGNVVYFVINNRGGFKYGFVVRTYLDEETDKYAAKIFTQDDEMIRAVIADKVKVHNRWDENLELSKASYYLRTIDVERLLSINGTGIERSMIKFMLNKNGEIKEIYIADLSKGINEENFSRSFDYYVGEDVFMRGFYYKDNTKEITPSNAFLNMFGTEAFQSPSGITSYTFIIPPEGSSDDEYMASEKNIVSGTANLEYYDVTEAGIPRCIVQYGRASTAKTGETKGKETEMIVAEFPTEVWNEEKEAVEYTLRAYAYGALSVSMSGGSFKTFTFADNEMVSFTVSGGSQEMIDLHSNIPISELKPGDLLHAYVTDNQINGFRVIAHNVGEPLTSTGELIYGFYDSGNNTIGENSYDWLQYGYSVKGKVIKAIDNTYFYVDTKNPNGIFRRVILNYTPNARDMVIIYDAKRKTVAEATSSDIREGDYMISYRNACAVVVRNYK